MERLFCSNDSVVAGEIANIRWLEQVEIPARPEFVCVVRRRVLQFVHDAGFGDDDGMDLAVAVSEAVSNAIEHATSSAAEPVVNVRCSSDSTGVRIVVRDFGTAPWKPEHLPQPRDPIDLLDSLDELSHRGRGLLNMQAFTDDLQIDITDRGTQVLLVKHRTPRH